MIFKPERPQLTPEMEQLLQQSRMHLVLCGGQTVGMDPPKYQWQIRPINEERVIQRQTEWLRQAAGVMGELHAARNHLVRPQDCGCHKDDGGACQSCRVYMAIASAQQLIKDAP